MISVAVLPIPPVRKADELKPHELEITTMRGTGPGGQHRNRTESCVRIVHKPTGIQAVIDMRDQSQSKREAMKIVTAKVNAAKNQEEHDKYAKLKKKQMKGGRGDKCRTYNFIRGFVKDHRLETKTHQVAQIMKGRFELLFKDIEPAEQE